MINNAIIFYISSFLIISFALVSLFAKNIIYSLLSAIIVFFSASIIFYILGSEYNAIIQAAVYGLAVPIIIGVSIMFTTEKFEDRKNFLLPYVILISSIIFLLFFVDTIILSNLNLPDFFRFRELEQVNSFDVLSAFARGIYIDYVWAFELLSILLTIVIAGFSLFKYKKSVNAKENLSGK